MKIGSKHWLADSPRKITEVEVVGHHAHIPHAIVRDKRGIVRSIHPDLLLTKGQAFESWARQVKSRLSSPVDKETAEKFLAPERPQYIEYLHQETDEIPDPMID